MAPLIITSVAAAHYPEIVASLNCSGTVTYTVTADMQNSTRDNADVVIVDTSGDAQPVAASAFSSANDWSFSGSYSVPAAVTFDTLTAEAIAPWGDGFHPVERTVDNGYAAIELHLDHDDSFQRNDHCRGIRL